MRWVPLVYNDCDLSKHYMISDDGQIYSLKTKKVLKQHLNKSTGYYGICVSLGSRENKKLIKLHIAVAINFVAGYKEGLVVNHKDGNKQNNNYSNLEWVTLSENSTHAVNNGLTTRNLKIKCLNNGMIFNSISDAYKWCGLKCSASIDDFLKNKNSTYAGKHPVTREKLQWELVQDH